MSDLKNRDTHEVAIAAALGEVGQKLLDELMDMLGDPPDINNVTAAFWESVSKAYGDALRSKLEAVFLDMVRQDVQEFAAEVAWDVINQRAADWARQYTFDLVSGITDNRRTALQEAVASFYEKHWTIGDLRNSLSNEYGPVRADMIAITETTRAAVEGNRVYVNELRKRGAEMVGKILTSNDDLVCEICAPKNGKDPETEGYPPFHVKCRCNVAYTPINLL